MEHSLKTPRGGILLPGGGVHHIGPSKKEKREISPPEMDFLLYLRRWVMAVTGRDPNTAQLDGTISFVPHPGFEKAVAMMMALIREPEAFMASYSHLREIVMVSDAHDEQEGVAPVIKYSQRQAVAAVEKA